MARASAASPHYCRRGNFLASVSACQGVGSRQLLDMRSWGDAWQRRRKRSTRRPHGTTVAGGAGKVREPVSAKAKGHRRERRLRHSSVEWSLGAGLSRTSAQLWPTQTLPCDQRRTTRSICTATAADFRPQFPPPGTVGLPREVCIRAWWAASAAAVARGSQLLQWLRSQAPRSRSPGATSCNRGPQPSQLSQAVPRIGHSPESKGWAARPCPAPGGKVMGK